MAAASSHQFQCPPSTRAQGTRRPFLISVSHFSQVCGRKSGLPATSNRPPTASTPVIQQQQALLQQRVHRLACSKHVPQGQLGLKLLPVLGRPEGAEVWGYAGPCVWVRGEG